MVSSQVKLLALLVVWIAMLASYSNSFDIGFQFDDIHTIQANPYVRSLKSVPRFFVDPKTSSFRPENSGYRPMTTTALALGYALAPENFLGYQVSRSLFIFAPPFRFDMSKAENDFAKAKDQMGLIH